MASQSAAPSDPSLFRRALGRIVRVAPRILPTIATRSDDTAAAPDERSLARTVALLGLAGTLLVLATLGWIANAQWQRTVLTSERANGRAAFFLAEHAARLFEASDLAIERTKALTAGREWDQVAADPTVHERLAELRDELPYLDDLWLNDAKGRVRQTSFVFPPPDGNASEREAFKAHAEAALGDRLFAAERIVGSVTGEPSLLASRRISAPDGTLRGVAFATLSVDYFTDLWRRAPLPEGARAVLFDVPGGAVLSRWPEMEGVRDEGLTPELAAAIAAAPDAGTYRDVADGDGTERLGGYARVGDWPLYVRVSRDHDALVSDWWNEVRPSALFAGLALAGLGALALFATHQVGRAERDRIALRREVIRRTADLRAQTGMLEVINRASRTLSEELDREEAVQRVVDLGTRLIGAEFGSFFYDHAGENGERIGLYALSGAPRERFAHFDHPRKTPLFAPTFEGRETVRSDDIADDPRYGGSAPHRGMPEGHLTVRSYLSVPVISRDGTVHGALLFGHGEPGRFTERHEALIQGIAAQAAIVMDNAALYAEAQDEIERRRMSEERQALLIRELHHRVKNTLATVRAIASISSRTATDMDTFAKGFTARLQALGETHTLLIDEAWGEVAVRDLIENELGPYRDEMGRVTVEGPDVRIAPERAVALGMAVHELTTNAAKHGALSTPTGRVSVSWDVEARDASAATVERDDGSEGLTVLSWVESGGPAVSPPTRRGFGSTLLDKVLSAQLGARAKADYAAEGLRYTISFPIEGKSNGTHDEKHYGGREAGGAAGQRATA